MPRKKKEEPKEEVTVDLGFGGLFKGLGNFLDMVSELAEKGDEVATRTGEFRVKGLGDKGRAVYGMTVRTGIGGIPRVEPFGNIRTGEAGEPMVADVREPLVDVFDEDEEIVVVVELPGVAEGEIKVEVQDDVLSLETTGEHSYAKEILLSEAVEATDPEKTYRNGILEVRLKKA
jgi:HSP20 family protein